MSELLDYPALALLAFVTATPIAWPLIRAFFRSAGEDVEEVVETPLVAWFGWFPEWTLLKLFWLAVVLLALTILLYKLYVFVGKVLGLVA